MLSEIGDWLHASGVRRLFFINSHVTNHAPVRCALEELRARHEDLMVALISTPDISPRVRAAFDADASDWHANAAETSLMMHLFPEIVRPDQLANADDPDRTVGLQFAHPVNRTSANGTTGSPSLASAAAGKELFEWMVEDLSERVARGLTENPPLPALWGHPL
jgi:creatinine amidohydrolase